MRLSSHKMNCGVEIMGRENFFISLLKAVVQGGKKSQERNAEEFFFVLELYNCFREKACNPFYLFIFYWGKFWGWFFFKLSWGCFSSHIASRMFSWQLRMLPWANAEDGWEEWGKDAVFLIRYYKSPFLAGRSFSFWGSTLAADATSLFPTLLFLSIPWWIFYIVVWMESLSRSKFLFNS